MFFSLFSLSGYAAEDGVSGLSTKVPHVVVILVDDMGYGDITAYNQFSKIQTPNMTRLANEGMRFTDAHAPGAVCHPSRYGLITGRYPFRTDVSVWPNEPLIAPGQVTIASLLKSNGYRTAMVGKWHLGFDEVGESIRTGEKDNSAGGYAGMAYRNYHPNQLLPGGPVDCGFDYFFGIRASTDIPPYFYIRNDRVLVPPVDSVKASHSDGWSNIQGAFWRAGGIAPDLELADVLPAFTTEAIQIIETHPVQHAEQPLFLYVALPAPHTPWLPSVAFRGTSGAGEYGDFVSMVDAQVGAMLSALERAGMAENTLVVLTSDNGPVWYPQDAERYDHHANAGIRSNGGAVSEIAHSRGMKGDAYEGGHRMPFIVRWPTVVEAGSITGQTVSFVDVMATIADIIDVELSPSAGEDSFSILPVLTGEQPEHQAIRPPVVTVSSRGVKSIQDRNWKLIESLGSGGFTSPAYIEPEPQGPRGQLYNMMSDPSETTNLWSKHPQRVEELSKLLRKWEHAGTSRPQ